jgi:hypothetical protein
MKGIDNLLITTSMKDNQKDLIRLGAITFFCNIILLFSLKLALGGHNERLDPYQRILISYENMLLLPPRFHIPYSFREL